MLLKGIDIQSSAHVYKRFRDPFDCSVSRCTEHGSRQMGSIMIDHDTALQEQVGAPLLGPYPVALGRERIFKGDRTCACVACVAGCNFFVKN